MAAWDVVSTAPMPAGSPAAAAPSPPSTIEGAVDPSIGMPRIVVTPPGAKGQPTPAGPESPYGRDQLVQFWQSKGASRAAAEGIADRIQAESDFNPGAVNPKSGATGLYQHLGSRKASLEKLPDWQSPKTQNDFAFSEVTGGDPIATAGWNQIKNAKSRQDAARLWDRYFERSGTASGWQVTGNNEWKVAPTALSEAKMAGDYVTYMDPALYLAMVPELPEGENKQSRSLDKSLAAGETIRELPHLDTEIDQKTGLAKVTDYDGRNRARKAIELGITAIPVAIRGIGSGELPKELQGMRPDIKPIGFDFKPIQGISYGLPQLFDEFGQGVRTAVGQATQAVSQMLPSGVESAVDRLNNFLSDHGVPLARVPQGGIAQMERDRAARLAAERGPSPTAGEAAGEVAAALPIAIAGGESIPGIAAAGAVGGALTPVTAPGGFWGQKAEQAGLGAAGAAGMGYLGRGLSRLATPARSAVQMLLGEGGSVTPGKMAGGALARMEDTTGSVSVLGAAVRAGQRRAIEDFNRVAYNRALGPIGERVPTNAGPVGYDGVRQVEQKLSRAYDAIKPHIHFKVDHATLHDIRSLAQLTNELPNAQREQFAGILMNRVVRRWGHNGTMDGETFKQVESELGLIARNYHASPDPAQRQLGDAIDELQATLRENIERHSPAVAKRLKAINSGWAAFTRVRDAAANRVKSLGVFSPADLLTATRRAAGKRLFARGDALMQDLARAGEEVLPSTVPDSGTPERLMTNHLLGMLAAGGAGYEGSRWAGLDPATSLAIGAGLSLPYTRPGMNLLRLYAQVLPKTANYLARAPRQAAAAFAPQVGSLAGRLINPPLLPPPGNQGPNQQ